MGYRVEYPSRRKQCRGKRRFIRFPLLILVCFVLFCFTVECRWQDGAAVLKRIFSNSNEGIGISALNCFAQELYDGDSVVASFSHFFRQVLNLDAG